MKILVKFLILIAILSSCSKNENTKKEIGKFRKISYDLRYNYFDSIAKNIKPNLNYQYWQYATFYQQYGGYIPDKYTVLAQGGDTLQNKSINRKIDPMKTIGIFQGGHPSYRCNYAVVVQNNKIHYINSEEEFRTFLGTIDNLEEAVMFARTYGYSVDSDIRGSQYREIDNGYELHLAKYHEFPQRKESMNVIITKNGFLKASSLGIYCKERQCN